MIHKFDNEAIFGGSTVTVEREPSPARVQVDTLPGVSGERIYLLGGGVASWRIRGRLFSGSMTNLQAQIAYAGSYNDGNLYVFRDSDGTNYRFCRLTDYRSIGPIDGGVTGYTCECEARVVCESPPKSSTRSPFPALSSDGSDGVDNFGNF